MVPYATVRLFCCAGVLCPLGHSRSVFCVVAPCARGYSKVVLLCSGVWYTRLQQSCFVVHQVTIRLFCCVVVSCTLGYSKVVLLCTKLQ